MLLAGHRKRRKWVRGVWRFMCGPKTPAEKRGEKDRWELGGTPTGVHRKNES